MDTAARAKDWKNAFAWAVPLIVWAVWLVSAVQYLQSERERASNAVLYPAEHLEECLSSAQTDSLAPGADVQATCNMAHDREVAELESDAHAQYVRLLQGYAGSGAAIAVAGAYFSFLPRRLRAGWRTLVVAALLAAVLGGTWLLLMVMNMSHSD